MRKVLLVLAIILLCASGIANARTGSMYSPCEFSSLGSLVVDSGTVSIYTGNSNPAVLPTITANGQVYYGRTDSQTAVIGGNTYSANLAVFSFDSVSIGQGVTISVSGSRALSLLSRGDITLRSNLDMGPVGYSDCSIGRSGQSNSHGCGGGGYGGDGGFGFSSSIGKLWPGAPEYGEASLASVLLGGSRGGNAWPQPGGPPGGQGGGAVELVAVGTLSVESRISANGQRGTDGFWSAAGGSGGSILMVATALSFGPSAYVQAIGGLPGNGQNTGTYAAGGRVAMYYSSITGYNSSMVNVAATWTAESGTVFQQNNLPLDLTPELGVSCNRNADWWYDDASFAFTDDHGFGGVARSYRYVWDQSPTHVWTDSEGLQWGSGDLTLTAGTKGKWYLHLKGYDAQGTPCAYFDVGPCCYGLGSTWDFTAGAAVEGGPSVVDGIAYFGSDDGWLYAVNVAGGGLSWKLQVGQPIKSRTVLWNDCIYFTTTDGSVHSIGKTTHALNWSRSVGITGLRSTPSVTNGGVYVSSNDGWIRKLAVSNGSVLWSFDAESPVSACPSVPPYAGGGMVIVGTDGGKVLGLRESSGQPSVAWTYISDEVTQAKGSPTVDWRTGRVIVGSNKGLLCLGIGNGQVDSGWTGNAGLTAGGVDCAAWIDADGGAVYAGAADGKLYGFSMSDGSALSGYPVTLGNNSPVIGAPFKIPGVTQGSYIYVSKPNCFYAINAANPADFLGFSAVGFSPAATSGISADDRLIVGSSDGKIRAFPLR